MRKDEFVTITKMISSYWNETFDDFKIKNWFELLNGFKFEGLRLSIQELAKETKFQPKISDIIEKYESLKREQDRKRIENSRKEVERLTEGQEKCHLCKNSGFVEVDIGGYLYPVRCFCPHGRDLNKFSQPQQNKDVKYFDPITKQEKYIYYPTIKEILGEEEFAIFDAKMKLKRNKVNEDGEMNISKLAQKMALENK